MNQKIIFFVYLIVLICPNVVLCFTEPIVPMGKFALILLPLAIYWLVMSISPRIHKTYLYMFPVLFLGAFNIVIGYLFGKGIVAVDMWLNLATTSGGEAAEMLSQIYPSVIAVVVIYIPTIGYAIFKLKKDKDLPKAFLKVQRKIGVGVLALSVPFMGLSLANERYAFLDDMFPVNVCYNLKLAVERQAASMNYAETSADFRYDAVSKDTLPEIVVFVIGETSRACNWQLCGYERPTNPELSKIDGVVTYRDCMSQSNTTHKSVPILLSPATAEDYSVLYTSKGIFQAYNEAGVHTVFISNEPRNHSFNDRLGEEAKDVTFLCDTKSGDRMDTEILPLLDKKLQSANDRLLIILHTYGSHSTYDERYEAKDAFFKPDDIVKATKENREILINAYDNTIRQTDKFLAEVIKRLEATERPSVMLYTSDHGEDIYDDDRNIYLHASPLPSYYQLHVPLIVWSSQSYAQAYPQRVSNMVRNSKLPVQSDCVFPTLLSLGGIETPYGQTNLSLALPGFKPKAERHYLTDHNEAVTFDRCMMPQDFEAMKKNGVRVN